MKGQNIDMTKMIEIFNQIAMREGYKLIVNEIDPLQFFSTRKQFYEMVDRLIEFYIESEEYEKCALLLEAKKKNGWKQSEVTEKEN